MKACLVRKVIYRLPVNKRLVWAFILCERNGLALLLVPKSHMDGSHVIVTAQENITERVFEAISPYQFELETSDINGMGEALQGIGRSFWETEISKHFGLDDFNPNDLEQS